MTIAGIGIECHVGHDRHPRHLLLDLTNGSGNQAIGVEALSAVFGFQPLGNLGEQNDATDPQVPGALNFSGQGRQTPPTGPWHGADGFDVGALMHKQWIDEIHCRQLMFPHHGAQGRGAA